MKAWMFNWNESLSPLDGAVVEKRRGGALACSLTSIKIVISNQSAHWPTIQNITHGTAAGPRWVTRLKSFFTEPGEMQTKRPELHCRFYSRSVFSHLWLLRAYRCHVSSCHRATTHPFICSRLGERKEKRLGGGALLVQADEENKQVQIWFLVEVDRASRRVCHQTHLHSSRFSLHPPRRRVHPSIHQREGLFTFGAAVFPLSAFSPHRWGAQYTITVGGLRFSCNLPSVATSPWLQKAQTPHYTSLRNWIKGTTFRATVRPPTLSEPTTFKVIYISARLFSFCFVLVNRCRFPFQVREHLQVWRLALEGGVVMADDHHRHLALRF